jgi:hypothetical protein
VDMDVKRGFNEIKEERFHALPIEQATLVIFHNCFIYYLAD